MASGTKSVVAGTDDGHAVTAFNNSNDGNYLGHISTDPYDMWLGFANVDIPFESDVDSLVLDVVAYDGSYDFPSPKIRIYGIKGTTVPADNTAYSALASLRTTSYVDWEPGVWTLGTHYQSPDLVEVATELVNWAGWSSGSKMIFVLVDNDSPYSAQRYIRSYNYDDGSSAPHIDYTWHEYVPPEAPEEGAPAIYVKTGGAWHPIDAAYVKTGGAWHLVDAVYVKEDGDWKQVL